MQQAMAQEAFGEGAAGKRPTCARCQLPQRSCVCALAVPVAHRTPVWVLQHPAEARHAKNTVRLLALSLAHCTVRVSEHIDDATLHAELFAPDATGRPVQPVLLYPATPGSAVWPGAVADPSDAPPVRLVVLDGTWRQSRQLLSRHPLLQGLPRLALDLAADVRADGCAEAAAMPAYAIRRAHAPHQLSTLEAVCTALSQREGLSLQQGPLADLLAAFGCFVAARQAWAARP
jgi:DTW domain-containing protein YfiP